MDRRGVAAMSAPVLRDYQSLAVDAIRAAYARGVRRVLFQLPTGGGKTVVFSYVVANATSRGTKTLILTHRQEIFEQVEAALALAGVPYGRIAPGCAESDAPVQIASISTLARPKRLERWRGWADFVVVDETQHAVAGSWARVLLSQASAKVLGVTATPQRLDGRGLGEIFDHMVVGPQTGELIKAGWLSPFVCFEPTESPDISDARIRAGDYTIEDQRAAVDNGIVIGAAVAEYQRICPGVPAVAFCVDVDHSQRLAQRFREAGVAAVHLDGETAASERRRAIAGLSDGSIKVVTNCGLISEGVDVPSIGAAILLRPTASVALYLQQVGRALRPAPGKDKALILDFSGNVARHGLPDEPRQWSLDSRPVKQRDRGDGPQLRRCKDCGALNHRGAHSCTECGADLRTPKERHEIEVALRRAREREDAELVASLCYRDRLSWAGDDESRLRFVERICGYKSGWAWHRSRELAEQRGERAHG
jgi:superfamily II DNA or RNA helicase